MPNNWLSPSSRWPFTGEFFQTLRHHLSICICYLGAKSNIVLFSLTRNDVSGLQTAPGGGGKAGITQFSGMTITSYFILVADIFRLEENANIWQTTFSKWIFLSEMASMWIQRRFISECSTDKSTIVKVRACHLLATKLLPESMLTKTCHHMASLAHNVSNGHLIRNLHISAVLWPLCISCFNTGDVLHKEWCLTTDYHLHQDDPLQVSSLTKLQTSFIDFHMLSGGHV